MTKKRIIIISGIAILLILAIIGWSSKEPNLPAGRQAPSPSPTLTSALPLANVSTAPQKEFLTDSKKTYDIVYDPNYKMYIISILGAPLDKIRLDAEQALIKKLNLSPDAACAQLKVHIGAPYYANPNEGQSYDTFSFCTK